MFGTLTSALYFLEQYITPMVFAIGAIVFFYGLVVYFIVGTPSGDEDMIDKGRKYLLRSLVIFFVALLLHGAVLFLIWLVTLFDPQTGRSNGTFVPGEPNFGADIERDRAILQTPNVPTDNPTESTPE